MISWPPTDPISRAVFASDVVLDRTTSSHRLPSEASVSHIHHSLPHETQTSTQELSSESYSVSISNTSSIHCFPTFRINLNLLTSLQSLTHLTPATLSRTSANPDTFGGGSDQQRKFNIVAAVLEIETGWSGTEVEMITIKKGKDAGKEVAVLKMVVGDESGGVCKLTAWREVAERWGGCGDIADKFTAIKKGDIVLIESECFVLIL